MAQKIDWRYDPSLDACLADLADGSFEVVQEADEDGDYYSYVRIRNSEQEVVETIYGGTLGRGNKPFNTGHKDYWELMNDLRAQAYRSAMGTDKIVSGMLTELDAENLPVEDEVPF